LPLDPSNHIQAVIPASILQDAIQASRTSSAALKSPPGGIPPELIFPSDYAVQCLHGNDRIEAAKQVLFGSKRLWEMDIYSESISSDLQSALTEKYENASPWPDGEILWMIEHYKRAGDLLGEDRWVNVRIAKTAVQQRRCSAPPRGRRRYYSGVAQLQFPY